jgi:hypothetical protein
LEEAGGVFVGEPPGLLHAGHLHAESDGDFRLDHPADQSRHLDRHAVPDRGRRLRAAAYARDFRVWRLAESDGRGVSVMAVPANDVGKHIGEERSAARSVLARDCGLRPADRVGILDRVAPVAVPRCAGASSSTDRRARATGVLCRAQADQSAIGGVTHGRAALTRQHKAPLWIRKTHLCCPAFCFCFQRPEPIKHQF